jgi:hypothetical protein
MVGELRARQIVHLHRLLRVVACEFEDDGMPADRLRAYRDQEVAPNDFKATKVEHEAALTTLAAALSEWADEQLPPDPESERRPPRIEP